MSEMPPPPPAPPAAPPPGAPATVTAMSPEDQRLWATLTHIGGILGVIVFGGGFGWLMPLITFLAMKDRGGFIREHTKNALNFQITALIGLVAGAFLTAILIGFLVIVAVVVLVIVFGIIAAVRANKGEMYEYPLTIKFIK